MKNIYTKKELQRIMTNKAMEYLANDEDLCITNTSYGYSLFETLIGLENGTSWDNIYAIIIGFERIGDFLDDEFQLKVYKRSNIGDKDELLEEGFKIYSIGNGLYSTDVNDRELHRKRLLERHELGTIMVNEFDIEYGTDLYNRLVNRIGKKIKKQDLHVVVRLGNRSKSYSVIYTYRNLKERFCLK